MVLRARVGSAGALTVSEMLKFSIYHTHFCMSTVETSAKTTNTMMFPQNAKPSGHKHAQMICKARQSEHSTFTFRSTLSNHLPQITFHLGVQRPALSYLRGSDSATTIASTKRASPHPKAEDFNQYRYVSHMNVASSGLMRLIELAYSGRLCPVAGGGWSSCEREIRHGNRDQQKHLLWKW